MTEFVQKTWNIHPKYTNYLAETTLKELETSFPTSMNKFPLLFISLFKNFCGGGKNEDLNIYQDQTINNKYENFDISNISFKE